MPTFFNPAANLTATRVPFSAGGGQLSDSSDLTYNTGTGLLTVGAAGLRSSSTSAVRFNQRNTGDHCIALGDTAMAGSIGFRRGSDGALQATLGYDTISESTLFVMRSSGGSGEIGFNTAAIERGRFKSTGEFLLGTSTNQSNGLLQLATHTTPGGGFGFFDFSMYRVGSGRAGLTADLEVQSSGYRFYQSGNAVNQRRGRIIQLSDGSIAFDQLDDAEALKTRMRLDAAGNLMLHANSVLRLGASFVAGAPAATGYLTVQDQSGGTYKLLCAP